MLKIKQQSFILNLFGTGVQIWDLDLPQEAMLKLETHQTKFNLAWEELIFNLEIVEKLGFSNWSDFATPLTPIRLLIDDTARIELRKKSRLVELIQPRELHSPSSLFSKYNVSNDMVYFQDPSQLRFLTRYKGMVSKFAFYEDSFRMDKLEFKLDRRNVQSEITLSSISINGVDLISKQDDLLFVRGEIITNK